MGRSCLRAPSRTLLPTLTFVGRFDAGHGPGASVCHHMPPAATPGTAAPGGHAPAAAQARQQLLFIRQGLRAIAPTGGESSLLRIANAGGATGDQVASWQRQEGQAPKAPRRQACSISVMLGLYHKAGSTS
jgi:hypothetical protein